MRFDDEDDGSDDDLFALDAEEERDYSGMTLEADDESDDSGEEDPELAALEDLAMYGVDVFDPNE